MEAEIEKNFSQADVRLIKGSGGVFDVTCEGELVFSKGRDKLSFPDPGEISERITHHLQA